MKFKVDSLMKYQYCIQLSQMTFGKVLLPTAREVHVFRGVCLFTGGGRVPTPLEADPPGGRPLVLTSSGSHCNSRYASFWMHSCLPNIF